MPQTKPLKDFDLVAKIAAPSGGTTVDAESRTAIGLIIAALENAGITLKV